MSDDANRSISIESAIKQFTDHFSNESIAIKSIDFEASLKNQNRGSSTLVKENVARMVAAHSIGVKFPPIVVNKVGDKYFIIDGNHRGAAYREIGLDEVDAYVVQVDHDTFTKMCLMGNLFNGEPLSEKDRLDHALQMVTMGMTLEYVSGVSGTPVHVLGLKVRAAKGRMAAARAGAERPDKISDTSAAHLARLEIDQIASIVKEVGAATASDLEKSVQAILSAPASERGTVATQQAGVLEAKRQYRKSPKAKDSMTAAQARTRVREVITAINKDKMLANDAALLNLSIDLVELINEVRNAEVAA